MLKKNPLLQPLSVLVGTWDVTMKHVAISEPLSWHSKIEWLENGFILWHWEGKNEVPEAKLIIASNSNTTPGNFTLLYYDARDISRISRMTFENKLWKFIREDEDFYQRFEGTVSEDGNRIDGHGENSNDKGKTWQHDYDIIYTRIG